MKYCPFCGADLLKEDAAFCMEWLKKQGAQGVLLYALKAAFEIAVIMQDWDRKEQFDQLYYNCQNAANGGATQATYVDNTNRNDIKTIRVAHDSQYLYMYVDCATTITPYQAGDTAWMNVLIGVEYGDDTSFGSYTYMVNRTPNVGNNTTTIHRYINKEWVQVGTAEYNLHGEVITFKIPLSDIGGSSSIRFKVSDNVQRDSRFNHNPIMNYYITGDSAPLGRLGYTYNF